MLITNMIWKQLSHMNSLTMTTRLLYLCLHCRQINKKCFCKYDNHKTIKTLCCKSKNLKDKVIHLFKVTKISWSLHTALICDVAPMNKFQHRHFDIFANISFLLILLVCITEPDFLPFLNASSAHKWKKAKT